MGGFLAGAAVSGRTHYDASLDTTPWYRCELIGDSHHDPLRSAPWVVIDQAVTEAPGPQKMSRAIASPVRTATNVDINPGSMNE